MRYALAVVLLALALATPVARAEDSVRIPAFWTEPNSYHMATNVNSFSPCMVACIQMLLDAYGVEPLPSQEEIDRGIVEKELFVDYLASLGFNSSFTDYSTAELKTFIREWYGILAVIENWRFRGISHAVVLTGFDSKGIFMHDPSIPLFGVNMKMSWESFARFYEGSALVISHRIGDPIPIPEYPAVTLIAGIALLVALVNSYFMDKKQTD